MVTEPIQNWGDAIFVSLSNALNGFLTALPLVVGALVILIIGWIISNVAARVVREVLERAGADRLFASTGARSTARSRVRSSRASSRQRS